MVVNDAVSLVAAHPSHPRDILLVLLIISTARWGQAPFHLAWLYQPVSPRDGAIRTCIHQKTYCEELAYAIMGAGEFEIQTGRLGVQAGAKKLVSLTKLKPNSSEPSSQLGSNLGL